MAKSQIQAACHPHGVLSPSVLRWQVKRQEFPMCAAIPATLRGPKPQPQLLNYNYLANTQYEILPLHLAYYLELRGRETERGKVAVFGARETCRITQTQSPTYLLSRWWQTKCK